MFIIVDGDVFRKNAGEQSLPETTPVARLDETFCLFVENTGCQAWRAVKVVLAIKRGLSGGAWF